MVNQEFQQLNALPFDQCSRDYQDKINSLINQKAVSIKQKVDVGGSLFRHWQQKINGEENTHANYLPTKGMRDTYRSIDLEFD